MFRCCEEKNRFNFGIYLFVYLSDAAFKLKVGGGAQATEDKTGIHLFAKIHGQAGIPGYAYPVFICEDQLNPFQTLLYTEEVFFLGIISYSNDDLVEDIDGPVNDRLVPDSDGIE